MWKIVVVLVLAALAIHGPRRLPRAPVRQPNRHRRFPRLHRSHRWCMPACAG